MEDVRAWLDLLALQGVEFSLVDGDRVTWAAPAGVLREGTLATLKEHRAEVFRVLLERDRRELDVAGWPADFQAAYRELVASIVEAEDVSTEVAGWRVHAILSRGVRYFAALDAGRTKAQAAVEAFGAAG